MVRVTVISATPLAARFAIGAQLALAGPVTAEESVCVRALAGDVGGLRSMTSATTVPPTIAATSATMVVRANETGARDRPSGEEGLATARVSSSRSSL